MAIDTYTEKMRKAIKSSKTDAEIDTVLNKIYDDGFYDGKEDAD
jgi:hypothetical protein